MTNSVTKPNTILVVDDEPATRTVPVRMLRDLGYETVEAADGSEAIHVYGETHERLIAMTLDLSMPETDGRTALALLSETAPFLPIVVISGIDLSEANLQGRLPGTPGVAYLKKPFRKVQPQASIEKVLREGGKL